MLKKFGTNLRKRNLILFHGTVKFVTWMFNTNWQLYCNFIPLAFFYSFNNKHALKESETDQFCDNPNKQITFFVL